MNTTGQKTQTLTDENQQPESGLIWIPPLQSVSTYSMAEFVQTSASPGDDSSGIFTAS